MRRSECVGRLMSQLLESFVQTFLIKLKDIWRRFTTGPEPELEFDPDPEPEPV